MTRGPDGMRYLTFAAIVLVLALAWVLVLPAGPAPQPAAFNHARHRGLACTVCHQGAEVAARAGLPEAAICRSCHATPPRGTEEAWRQAGAAGQIAWAPTVHLPDHVMFSHRRHVALARLDCVSCHADVGARPTLPSTAPVRLDMNACLSCHRREAASEDCAACHR